MSYKYFGCENAASATAKIVFPTFNETYYFGDINDASDFINTVKKTWDLSDWTYEYHLRDINWESGAVGNWYCVETGSRVEAHSTINL